MAAENVLPFKPRTLSQSERRREDIYLYRSPKAQRKTELVGCLTVALALRFEFDPLCSAFVERPRRLCVGDRQIELGFWTRHDRGRERFWLLVPADDTRDANTPRRTHREASALIAAAQAAQISLDFVFEDEIKKQAAAVSTQFRMLPFVQTAIALPSRDALRQHVLAVFDSLAQATFDQVEGNLRAFHAADVRCVICDLIHCGMLALADDTRIGRFSVVTKRETAHEHA